MEDFIRFDCPACGESIKAKPELAGRQAKCPKRDCRAAVQVPQRLPLDDAPPFPPRPTKRVARTPAPHPLPNDSTKEPSARNLRVGSVAGGVGLLVLVGGLGTWFLTRDNAKATAELPRQNDQPATASPTAPPPTVPPTQKVDSKSGGEAGRPKPTEKPVEEEKPLEKSADPDRDLMQGVWYVTSLEAAGKIVALDSLKRHTWTFKGDNLTIHKPEEKSEAEIPFKLDSKKSPKWIDLSINGKNKPSIYHFDGKNLQVCMDLSTLSQRPADFQSEPDTLFTVVMLSRQPGARPELPVVSPVVKGAPQFSLELNSTFTKGTPPGRIDPPRWKTTNPIQVQGRPIPQPKGWPAVYLTTLNLKSSDEQTWTVVPELFLGDWASRAEVGWTQSVCLDEQLNRRNACTPGRHGVVDPDGIRGEKLLLMDRGGDFPSIRTMVTRLQSDRKLNGKAGRWEPVEVKKGDTIEYIWESLDGDDYTPPVTKPRYPLFLLGPVVYDKNTPNACAYVLSSGAGL